MVVFSTSLDNYLSMIFVDSTLLQMLRTVYLSYVGIYKYSSYIFAWLHNRVGKSFLDNQIYIIGWSLKNSLILNARQTPIYSLSPS